MADVLHLGRQPSGTTSAISSGDGHELAMVLREVERYIADAELLAIRFCVDDRYYVMHNPPLTRFEAA